MIVPRCRVADQWAGQWAAHPTLEKRADWRRRLEAAGHHDAVVLLLLGYLTPICAGRILGGGANARRSRVAWERFVAMLLCFEASHGHVDAPSPAKVGTYNLGDLCNQVRYGQLYIRDRPKRRQYLESVGFRFGKKQPGGHTTYGP